MSTVGDWIGEITTTTGAGTITLGGVVSASYTTFSSQIADAALVWYVIKDGDDRESGQGTFDSSANTLARTNVNRTLVAGTYDDSSPAAIDLSGNAQVYCTFNKEAYDDLVADFSSAVTAAANAATSETNAATSETNAATSAAAAASSETAAAASVVTASGHATSANNSATNAATSETNAATSASNASTSETNAAASASAASTSETNAATSETNAATSASNAATSETNAATSETNAATSETNAQTAETNATTITINAQVGTSYTVLASDKGKLITLNNASDITLTINTGLGAGFNFIIEQLGAGKVTWAGTATVNNVDGHTQTRGENSQVSFIANVADTFTAAGATQ